MGWGGSLFGWSKDEDNLEVYGKKNNHDTSSFSGILNWYSRKYQRYQTFWHNTFNELSLVACSKNNLWQHKGKGM